jgi:hypothetical protein
LRELGESWLKIYACMCSITSSFVLFFISTLYTMCHSTRTNIESLVKYTHVRTNWRILIISHFHPLQNSRLVHLSSGMNTVVHGDLTFDVSNRLKMMETIIFIVISWLDLDVRFGVLKCLTSPTLIKNNRCYYNILKRQKLRLCFYFYWHHFF